MEGVIKLLLAGADVTLLTSALLHQWPRFPAVAVARRREVARRARIFIDRAAQREHEPRQRADPSALERANYTQALVNYSTQHVATYSK